MSFNLQGQTEPISWNDLDPAALKNLQANIIKAHRMDYAKLIFLKFKDGKRSEIKRFLRETLVYQIKTAYQQREEEEAELKKKGEIGEPLVNFFLSQNGYTYLGYDVNGFQSSAFKAGMGKRSKLELIQSDKSFWDPLYQKDIDAMILIGGLTLKDGKRVHAKKQVAAKWNEIQKLKPASIQILREETGKTWRNKRDHLIEHFGFVDGQSQPLFLKEDIEKEKEKGGIDQWDPTTFLKQVLIEDPFEGPDSFGSYLVFCKLEQNVKAFKELEKRLTKALSFRNKELAGAMLIGRFRDGTPLVSEKPTKSLTNNFNYEKDREGMKCPFHVHIRKVNPRVEAEKKHLLARRGITYGPRKQNRLTREFIDQPTHNVGLLFMAYQSSIEDQFEFIQNNWVNAVDFFKNNTGVDPIIGNRLYQFPTKLRDQQSGKEFINFSDIVTLKGGEYFFAPSLSFFKNLSH